MILTVTPDPVVDKVFIIDEWLPSSVMHAKKVVTSVGGKGLDASVALRHLGEETTALSFLAGENGQQLSSLVENYGIHSQPIWVSGETRCANIVAEQKHQRHSHLFSGGISVNASLLDKLLEDLDQQLEQTNWLLTGGIFPSSLPPDFFAILTQHAHQTKTKILIDAHSEYIRPSISSKPDVIKMNRKEFEWTFDTEVPTFNELIFQAGNIYEKAKLNALVITCGADGILAFTTEGIIHAHPPSLQVINAAGAGDAASAAIAWRRNLGDNWEIALQWAASASAAVVLTEGTADLLLDDVMKIFPEVTTNIISETC
jgi:1-phosphofructokinase family hexose kinase